MKTLLELFQKYNNYNQVEYPSDKNSCHSYIEDVYEEYFAEYRNKKYEYKIFDLRKSVVGREGVPKEGRGDNVILAIKPL